jgi:hypothetical protein
VPCVTLDWLAEVQVQTKRSGRQVQPLRYGPDRAASRCHLVATEFLPTGNQTEPGGTGLPDPWRKGLPTYRDVKDRAEVLGHFSNGELALAVLIGFLFVIAAMTVLVAVPVRVLARLSR